MKSFFESSETQWTRPDGCLHFYAIPAAEASIRRAFADMGGPLHQFPELGIQPIQHLHMTLQRLSAFEGDLGDPRWRRLRSAMPRVGRSLAAVRIPLDPPRVRERAVEAVSTETAGWATVAGRIRRAVQDHGLGETLAETPHGPHVTLAYCRSAVDDSRVRTSIGEVARPTEFLLDRISLVAVRQDPVAGIFEYRVIQEWPVGSSNK